MAMPLLVSLVQGVVAEGSVKLSAHACCCCLICR